MEIKAMSTQQIQEQTLSTGAATPNVVYKAIRDTVLIRGIELIDAPARSLAIISGCGEQKGRHGHYMHGKDWTVGVNEDWEHYANPILAQVNF